MGNIPPSPMPSRHAAPVVLISGASRGIGRAIAEDLLQHGYRLSLGARDPDTLQQALAAQFPASIEQFRCHRYDALDNASAARWVDDSVATFGGIDVLVNNAGIGTPLTIEDDDDDALDTVWAVNVKAPLRMTRLCLPHLKVSGHGRVVNVASLSGKRARNPQVAYSMSKFAVMALTHTTRQIGWEHGIRATAVCPGFVQTDMTRHVTKVDRDDMIPPDAIATLVRTAIALPNNAAMAEMLVNCRLEDML
jgi:NAD(P)-dependent dehydrogenase (short-subunit alcohol dehydrogenase family)